MAKFGCRWDEWFGMEPERRAELIAHEYERRLRDAHWNDHQLARSKGTGQGKDAHPKTLSRVDQIRRDLGLDGQDE